MSATAKKKTISVMIFNPCNVVIKRRSQTVCAVITPKTLQDDDEWLIPILSITGISKVAMFQRYAGYHLLYHAVCVQKSQLEL